MAGSSLVSENSRDSKVEVIAATNMFHAAASAASMSASGIGTSRPLQPVCIGVRSSSITSANPVAHVETMHCSTASRRFSLEAKHIVFWSFSAFALYPASSMHDKTQPPNAKVTLSLLVSLSPRTYIGTRAAAQNLMDRTVGGSILLDLLLQRSEWVGKRVTSSPSTDPKGRMRRSTARKEARATTEALRYQAKKNKKLERSVSTTFQRSV